MVDISVILATARQSYGIIIGLENLHILEPTFNSLEKQTFREFEVILVDALYSEKRQWIEEGKWSFPVKYVPVHLNHRFWLDRKRWNIGGALNTGVLWAEGELIVRIDDCSEFKPDYLAKFWQGYQSGCFPLAMHIRYLEGKPVRVDEKYLEKGYEAAWSPEAEPVLREIYGEGDLVRDTRYPLAEARGGRMTAYPNMFYGYSSFSLESALKINGFNELCDGQKGLEDVEFGERLVNAGYRNMFLLDVDLQVIEHEHYPIAGLSGEPIVCVYGLIQFNRRQRLFRANEKRLTFEDCEWIRCEVCPECDNLQRCLGEKLKGKFYIEGENFDIWISHQPIFNLREERLTI